MTNLVTRIGACGACIAFTMCAPAPTRSRPFGIDDLLHTETLAQSMVSPGGRWLIIEKRGALADAGRFDTPTQTDILRSRLFVVDLDHPAQAHALTDAGVVALAFSPDGRKLAVGRLKDGAWTLGIAEMATGTLRWFPISPDYSPFRHSLEWLSADRLALIALVKDMLPWYLQLEGAAEPTLPLRWMATRSGHAAMTEVGSGRYRDRVATPADSHLLLLDTSSGTVRNLAQGPISDIRASPDHRHIAMIVDGTTIQPSPQQRLTVSTDTVRRHLAVVDLAGARWQPCGDQDINLPSVTWSGDGSALAFVSRMPGADWTAGTLWTATPREHRASIVPTDGLAPVLLGAMGDREQVGTAWRGDTPLIFAGRIDGKGETGWYSLATSRAGTVTPHFISNAPRIARLPDGKAIGLDDRQAVRLDTQGNHEHKRMLTNRDAIHTDLDGDGHGLWSWRREGAHLQISLDGQSHHDMLLTLPANVEPIAASSHDDTVILREIDAHDVVTLSAAHGSGDLQPLMILNQRLEEVDPARKVPLRYKGGDGQDAVAWLYLPANGAAGVTPPLVVIPYPGTLYDSRTPVDQDPGLGRLYANAQMLVGQGFAVLTPSMPMPPVSSQHPYAFADEILPAVDAAVARGLVDPARLALWGHSFGGYAAATVATETDRFKTIVTSSGVYDLASFRGTFAPFARAHPEYGLSIMNWAGWSETGQAGLGGPPWRWPERYVANSPVYHADRIHTPMLIIGGDRDITPIQQAEELFSALYRQGKDADLLTYWAEGHVISSPDNVRELYTRIFAWLDEHLATSVPQPVQISEAARTDRLPSRDCHTRAHCSTRSITRSSE